MPPLRHRGRPWICAALAVLIAEAAPAFAPRTMPGDARITRATYAADGIPDSLRVDAHAVVRYERTALHVFDARTARLTVHRIITVLDPEGRSSGELAIWYNSFQRIRSLEGRIYDAHGREIRSLEDHDVHDLAATSSGSLFEDARVRTAGLYEGAYPYTVELSYDMAYDGYLNWPSWYPEEKGASVEFSEFSVTTPDGERLRSWADFVTVPTIEHRNGEMTTTWEASGLPAFFPEPMGPDISDQYRCVRIAPSHFIVGGTSGDLSSWKSFGSWVGALYRGRQDLPPAVQQEVRARLASARSARDTVRLLYEYMQEKTRYVSVQLGIGGWQPFAASYVAEKGYGDCKALVNYMGSLLALAGMESFPALIQAGSPARRLAEDFPANVFDHVILMVPSRGDTLWLECTDQTAPFASLSRNTEDRPCLILTPSGGELARTPASHASDNVRIQSATVTLGSAGDGVADVRAWFSGDQHDGVRHALQTASPKDRNDWLREWISVPSFRLHSADFAGLETKDRHAGIAYRLELPHYATKAGARLLFRPNLLERDVSVPHAVHARKNAIVHPYPYLDIDSITFLLPPLTAIEAVPEAFQFETSFAAFSASVAVLDASTILYTRRLEIKSRELPAERFGEYREFIEKVAKVDKQEAVIVRN